MRLLTWKFNFMVLLWRYPREISDAYERLLLDAIEGERRLFIRSDELDAAWALFTPLLKDLEEKKIAPELYPYGSRGPVGAHYLAAKYNVRWGDLSGEDSWLDGVIARRSHDMGWCPLSNLAFLIGYSGYKRCVLSVFIEVGTSL